MMSWMTLSAAFKTASVLIIRLPLLRAFVGIVECGSISAGARRLKIPQPTLSRYLRALEQRWRSALAVRYPPVSLTQTGQRLLADAETLLAHGEAADQRNAESLSEKILRWMGGTGHEFL
jgi:DNA-binding transcriptional LysR family regulator